MKTNKFFQFLTLAICAVAFAFVTGCEGPEGPMGTAGTNGTNGTNGADGADGADGSDGTNGVDGNVSCLVCHTQAGMDVINASYALSGHASGSTVGYAGGRSSCSPCHSAELFTNYIIGASAVDIANPTKIRCSTCHSNHSSLEDGISAPMVTVAAVTAITDGTSVFDFESVSNLCANCHQSRKNGTSYDKETEAKTYVRKFTDADDIAAYTTAAVGPNGSIVLDQTGTTDTLVVTFDVPVENVYISSTHAGPHHGPQANTIFGVGGYGSGSTSTHTTAGCVACHMGIAGDTEGGHSWIPNLENCNTAACHDGSATDFDVNGTQTDVNARLDAIATALEAVHAIHIDGTTGEVHPAYASIPRAEFEAFWNYMIVAEDMSSGVHNTGYIETLLTVAETKLNM